MSINIRYPNITGLTEKEQLNQIRSYLHQLVEQLNYALPILDTEDGKTQLASDKTYDVQGGELSYYELRTLIFQKLQEIDERFKTLERTMQEGYVKKSGWQSNKHLVTNDSGDVVAGMFTFTLDEGGNLYYEVEE